MCCWWGPGFIYATRFRPFWYWTLKHARQIVYSHDMVECGGNMKSKPMWSAMCLRLRYGLFASSFIKSSYCSHHPPSLSWYVRTLIFLLHLLLIIIFIIIIISIRIIYYHNVYAPWSGTIVMSGDVSPECDQMRDFLLKKYFFTAGFLRVTEIVQFHPQVITSVISDL